jgi:hypothetical protein
MEKTLIEWFEMFPEPYRTQAIENTIQQTGEEKLKETAESAVAATSHCFYWSASPQGARYWVKFSDQLIRNEITLIERAERMYSEEEVEKIAKELFFTMANCDKDIIHKESDFEKWFKQHKK